LRFENGFTVIELLISISIFTLILTGLTVSLMQQQRQMNFTKESVDLGQTGRAVLDLVSSEIRNAAARQGKNFSIIFSNGGSQPDGQCGAETTQPGTVNSPPDCFTVLTWDKTRGQFVDTMDIDNDGDTQEIIYPSVKADVDVNATIGSTLVLNLPDDWFPNGVSILKAQDLLGFRSRVSLCSPNPSINCGLTPSACTECAAILRVSSVNSSVKTVTIDASAGSPIIGQNMVSPDPATFTDFVNNYFIQRIATQVSEMSIVKATTFSIDTTNEVFMVERDLSGPAMQYAGGPDAPSVVDMQLVFNVENPDGSTTKVGLPKDTTNNKYASFSDAAVAGSMPNVRTVEIYLLLKSRLRPHLLSGANVGVQTIPRMGDRAQRTSKDPSLGEGFFYKIFTTTVYVRNLAREEFG